MARPGNFISNFEPLTKKDAQDQIGNTLLFEKYTKPIRELINSVAKNKKEELSFVSSANPRIVDGKPSKNPRYLQTRPDLFDPRSVYLATAGTRLKRGIKIENSVLYPVRAVLPGRRNNPADKKSQGKTIVLLCSHPLFRAT